MQQQLTQQPDQMGTQQALGQQMVLCPVRLVYETQILVQPGDHIQPNQTFFINPQNPPPWMQNSLQNSLQPRQPMQNQVVYVHQLPNNMVSTLQQPMDQNQLYLQQGFQNFQIQQQMLAQSPQEMRPTMQLANIMPNMVQNIQTTVPNERTVQNRQMQPNPQMIQNQIAVRPVQNQVTNPALEVQGQVYMRPQIHQQGNIQRPIMSVNHMQNIQQQTLASLQNVGPNTGQTFTPNTSRPGPSINTVRTSMANNVVNIQAVPKVREVTPSNVEKTVNGPVGNIAPSVRNFVPNYYRPIQPRPQIMHNVPSVPKAPQHVPVQTVQTNPVYNHDKNNSHQNNSQLNNSHQNNSHQNSNHQNNSHQNNSHYNNSSQNNSHQNNSHQNTNHQNNSHQNNSHQNNSHHNNSPQNNSHQNTSHQNNSHQNNSHQNNSHQNNSHQNTSHQNNSHQINSHQNNTHQNNNQQNSGHQNATNNYTIIQELNNPIINRKRKSESPDDMQKKLPSVQNIKHNYNTQNITKHTYNPTQESVSKSNYNNSQESISKTNYHTMQCNITATKIVNEIGTNTSPIHRPKLNPQFQMNNIQIVKCNDESENRNKESISIQDTDKLKRNTVYTQARGRVLQDKTDEIKIQPIEITADPIVPAKIAEQEPVVPEVVLARTEATPARTEIELKTRTVEIPNSITITPLDKEVVITTEKVNKNEETEIQKKDVQENIKIEEKMVEKVELTNESNQIESVASDIEKMDVENQEESSVSEKTAVKQEVIDILTHVVDGYVIQESNIAFPIRKPLKEKTLHTNLKSEEKERDLLKESMKEELKSNAVDIPLLPFHYLLLDSAKEEKEKAEEKEREEARARDDPFSQLQQTTVKTWTVDDLSTHLMKFNWKETVSLLQDHEIDGESLFLVSKPQLLTIGVTEEHADAICEFVKS